MDTLNVELKSSLVKLGEMQLRFCHPLTGQASWPDVRRAVILPGWS
jgi:hypothetical protein